MYVTTLKWNIYMPNRLQTNMIFNVSLQLSKQHKRILGVLSGPITRIIQICVKFVLLLGWKLWNDKV